MARVSFVCQSCGNVTTKWSGKCDACGAWNSISEETASSAPPIGKGAKSSRGKKIDLTSLSGNAPEPQRAVTGIHEFDRVLGGGLVPGSAILIGGDPGIGKSTLLIQAAASIAQKGGQVVYISGEEALAQLRMRAARLGLADAPVMLGAETNIADILKTIEGHGKTDLVIIDSIQTMWSPALDAAPGTVSQVRTAGQELIHFAKKNNTALILVGHVTKDGQIAGPRVLEHMVDTVVYFEGDLGDQFRLLRSVKNRFGPAHEIGVFEMRGTGLHEVSNPSALFLETRDDKVAGAAGPDVGHARPVVHLRGGGFQEVGDAVVRVDVLRRREEADALDVLHLRLRRESRVVVVVVVVVVPHRSRAIAASDEKRSERERPPERARDAPAQVREIRRVRAREDEHDRHEERVNVRDDDARAGSPCVAREQRAGSKCARVR